MLRSRNLPARTSTRHSSVRGTCPRSQKLDPTSSGLKYCVSGTWDLNPEPWFLRPGSVHQPREFGFSEFAEQLEELPGLVP